MAVFSSGVTAQVSGMSCKRALLYSFVKSRQENRWLLNMMKSGNKSFTQTFESIDMLFPKVMVAALLSLDDGGAIQKVVVLVCERSYHFVSSGGHPILVDRFSML